MCRRKNGLVKVPFIQLNESSVKKNALEEKAYLYLIDGKTKFLVVGTNVDNILENVFLYKGINVKLLACMSINGKTCNVYKTVLPDVVLSVKSKEKECCMNLCRIDSHCFLEIRVKSLKSMSFTTSCNIVLSVEHWQDIKNEMML